MSSVKFVLCAGALIAAAVWGLWHGQDSTGEKAGPDNSHERTASARPGDRATTGGFAAIFRKMPEGGEIPKPTSAQLRAFVEKEGHSAASLLAACQLSDNMVWLEEAAQRYPDDPRVALAMLATMNEQDPRADEWIARFKQADSGNGIAWCYEAMRAFREGSPEAARAALRQAAQRGKLDAYVHDSASGMERAYRDAGFEGVAAEQLGSFNVHLPQLTLLSKLKDEALNSAGAHPDDGLVQDLLALAKSLRGHEEDSALIDDLVGASLERQVLNQLYALELVPGTRDIVAQRLTDLEVQHNTVKALTEKAAPLKATMSESEWKQYVRRTKVEGELKAMEWLIQQRPGVN